MPTVLDQLLVEIGLSAEDLSGGVQEASRDIDLALAGVGDSADTMGREVVQAADRAADALAEVGASADEAAQAADQAATDVGGSFQGIAAAGAGAAVGGAFAAGLANAMDSKAATTKLANQLGLTAEESERAGKVAGDVYSAGFSDSMGGVSEALGAVTQAMGGLGKVSDEQLSELTKSAIMLGDTFAMDVGESATAAGRLIDLGLAKDGKHAFDILTRAAQTLPTSMIADIPATVTEYGKHFQRLGISGETAFGMLGQYAAAGGRDIDQAADVIHEFARITSEETDRAAEGFKALGLDSSAMLKSIGEGGPAAEQALSATLTALRGVKDPAKQAALGVQLFGDMAGEGADALWAMDPATAAAATGMDEAAGAAERATGAMEESQTMEAVWRELSTTLGEVLLPVLSALSEWASDNPALVRGIIAGLLALAVVVGIMTVAQWAWNTALFAWPGTWIIAGILAVIAVVALVIVYWDDIKKFTIETWDAVVEALGAAWDWIKDTSEKTWAAVTEGLTAAWDWVERVTAETWAAITKGLSDAWEWTRRTASEIWAATAKVFSDGWQWMVRNVFNPIGHFFTNTIPGWVSTGVEGAKSLWDGLVGWFASIPGRLASIGNSLWGFITAGLKGALNGAIYLVNRSIEFINGLLIGNANRIPGVNIGYIPFIPYLAEGGVTTGPTLAMIGEGDEQEAVLPLSVLDGMLQATAGPVVQVAANRGPQEVRVVLDVTGGSDAFVAFFKETVQTRAAGSVIRLGEG
ncbi:phage tail tape measure protein [Streptomyces sp. NPDC014861]|uniref:phage tail tape measure protein n=1 Tax=Streptomyces sp. NPDC014861 TaxID=3364923 RepID=UPI0037036AB0